MESKSDFEFQRQSASNADDYDEQSNINRLATRSVYSSRREEFSIQKKPFDELLKQDMEQNKSGIGSIFESKIIMGSDNKAQANEPESKVIPGSKMDEVKGTESEIANSNYETETKLVPKDQEIIEKSRESDSGVILTRNQSTLKINLYEPQDDISRKIDNLISEIDSCKEEYAQGKL